MKEKKEYRLAKNGGTRKKLALNESNRKHWLNEKKLNYFSRTVKVSFFKYLTYLTF